MASAAKFLFATDFRQPAGDPRAGLALEEAEARGYGRGVSDGLRQARAEGEARTALALERIAGAVEALLSDADRHRAATEALALDFALALARKLAGEALAREPLAAIAEAAREAFEHLRGVPHLVVRVNEALVEAVDGLLPRLARERGYEGRLVTLGDPEIPPGDARLEWADGGIVRDRTRIERSVDEILRQCRQPPDSR